MTDWPVKTLGEVCLGIDRQDPATSGRADFTYIDLSAVNQMTKQIEHSRILAVEEAPGRARQLVQTGDVLVSTVRPNLNAVALVESELDGATASTGFCVLRPNRLFIEPGLLFAWVRNQLFIDELTSLAKGASYPAVTDDIVKALKMPVPPLEEQKRIVALLDAATSRVTELTACYVQARAFANNLFTSALRDALESNPDWPVKTLGEVCVIDWGNTNLTKKSYVEGGKFLAVSAAGPDGRIDHAEHKAFTPVLSAIGARCGRMFLPIEDFTAIKNTITLTPKDESSNGEFIFYLLEYSSLPIRGAAQPFMAKGDIEKFEISVPSLKEQTQIVSKLKLISEKTSEMVSAYDAKLTAAVNLRQSILEAAFAGDL